MLAPRGPAPTPPFEDSDNAAIPDATFSAQRYTALCAYSGVSSVVTINQRMAEVTVEGKTFDATEARVVGLSRQPGHAATTPARGVA